MKWKSKTEKHATDNEKRCRAIKEKEKAKLNQSEIIKQALSNSSLNNSSSKKIKFTDESNDFDNTATDNVNIKGKALLFNDSDSEGENFEIKEKVQFGGKKGLELLNLQSTYGNDERFKIDERFLEDEEEGNSKECTDELKHENDSEEKSRQLKILESVLGEPLQRTDNEKKAKKRSYEMVRYDASNKDHEKYEIQSEPNISKIFKKRNDKKKIQRSADDNFPRPEVSKEKFYEVSNEIQKSFKEKKEEGGGFSLLQTYGQNSSSFSQSYEDDEEMNENVEEVIVEEKKKTGAKRNEVKENNVGFEKTPKPENKIAVAKGIWKEPFFFGPDDPRFKEGLEFMNKKNSEEAVEAAENYHQTRRTLKMILRLHMKKQLQREDPFKNKVGGMNKKQLATLKLKNSRKKFSQKRHSKVKDQ